MRLCRSSKCACTLLASPFPARGGRRRARGGGVQYFGHQASRRRTAPARDPIDRAALRCSIIYYRKYGGMVRHAVVNLRSPRYGAARKQRGMQRGKLELGRHSPPFPTCWFYTRHGRYTAAQALLRPCYPPAPSRFHPRAACSVF